MSANFEPRPTFFSKKKISIFSTFGQNTLDFGHFWPILGVKIFRSRELPIKIKKKLVRMFISHELKNRQNSFSDKTKLVQKFWKMSKIFPKFWVPKNLKKFSTTFFFKNFFGPGSKIRDSSEKHKISTRKFIVRPDLKKVAEIWKFTVPATSDEKRRFRGGSNSAGLII